MRSLLFSVGLSLFACHELDAVARHEWRLLPILGRLDDPTGEAAFVLAHAPLFTTVFWSTAHPSALLRRRSRMFVDCFLVGHALLHFALSGHPLYEFRPPVESITVYGAALAAAADLFASRAR